MQGVYACVGLGSGSFTYTDASGVVYPTMGVQLFVSGGTVHITNSGVFEGLVMHVDATLTGACAEGGILHGTLSRVHV